MGRREYEEVMVGGESVQIPVAASPLVRRLLIDIRKLRIEASKKRPLPNSEELKIHGLCSVGQTAVGAAEVGRSHDQQDEKVAKRYVEKVEIYGCNYVEFANKSFDYLIDTEDKS